MSWLTLVTRVAGQSIVMAGGQRGRVEGETGKAETIWAASSSFASLRAQTTGGAVVTSGH